MVGMAAGAFLLSLTGLTSLGNSSTFWPSLALGIDSSSASAAFSR